MAKAIEVVIVGDATQLQAALGKSAAAVEGFAGKATAAGTKMAAVGKTLTTHLTLPLVAAAAVSVKFAMDFQHSMELVHTQAGASQKEVSAMSAAVLKLSPAVATGPNELAKALYHIESVGLRGAKALNVLKEAALGAKVGGADLEATTNALSAAWVSGIQGAHNMRAAMGTLNAIVGVGNMRMDDLAAAMSSGILPRAKTFGISLQSVGAALATMTDAGVPAQAAATRLGMTFSLLGAPTSKAAAMLKTIGINSLDLANSMRKPGGLQNAVQMLADHMQGLSKTAQAALLSGAFGGGRSSGTIMTLIGNLDRLKTKYDAIGQGISKYGAAVKATTETAQFKFNQALAQLEVTGIQIGSTLLPIFVRLAGGVASLASAFSGLSKPAQDLILVFGGILAALGPILYVGGSVLKVVGALSRAFTGLAAEATLADAAMTPFGAGLIILGAAAVGAGIYFLVTAGHTDAMTTAMNNAKTAANQLGDALSGLSGANLHVKEAEQAHKEAAQALTDAEKHQQQLIQQGKKGTKEYAAAVNATADAKNNLGETNLRLGSSEQELYKATAKNKQALDNNAKALAAIGDAATTSSRPIGRAAMSLHNSSVQAQVSRTAFQKWQAGVAASGDAASKAAADMKNGLTPEMRRGKLEAAAMAIGALDLGKKIGGIPSQKQILVKYLHDLGPLIKEAQILQQAIDSLHSKVVDIVTNYHVHTGAGGTNPGYKGNAAGTSNWRGGWSWVGERGPELMRLPAGTQIKSHSDSVRGGSTQVNLVLDRKVLASVMVDAEKTYRRQNAGRSLFAV